MGKKKERRSKRETILLSNQEIVPVKKLAFAFPIVNTPGMPDDAERHLGIFFPCIYEKLLFSSVRGLSEAVEGVEGGREGRVKRRSGVFSPGAVCGRDQGVHHG